MTKCVVLGQEPTEKKKIELISHLTQSLQWDKCSNLTQEAAQWENIDLISRNYGKGKDLMFAYDDDRSKGCLFIGYWNDGVV